MGKPIEKASSREGRKQTSAVVWGAEGSMGGCRRPGQRHGKAAESEGPGMSSRTFWNVIPGTWGIICS